MRREIKFRAWNKRGRYPQYRPYMVDNIHEACDLSPEDTDNVASFYGFFYGDDYEIMQYTGLKDKNGKQIYEGDIIKTEMPNFEDSFWRVYFGEDYFFGRTYYGWMVESITDNKILLAQDPCIRNYRLSDSIASGEVIGNIYENPELLKKVA